MMRPFRAARSALITMLTMAALASAACSPDKEAADRQFQDLLDELAGELPAGKADFFGSIKDRWNSGKAAAERLWLCKVLRPVFNGDPEQHRTIYLAGAMVEGSIGGVSAIYGRESAYDLHHYQAAGYRFFGGGLASELLAAGASLYEGVGTGNHGSVLDLLGPRGQVRGGVQLPVGIAKVGVTLTGFHQRPRPGVAISGALLGITGQLTATPHVPSVKGVAGWWSSDPAATAAVATRDADLGALQYYLPASCGPAGQRTSFVQYGSDRDDHATRGKAMAKALLRAHSAARFSPVTRGLSVSIAALGVARDNGGFDYLCDEGEPQDSPTPRPDDAATATDCMPVLDDGSAPVVAEDDPRDDEELVGGAGETVEDLETEALPEEGNGSSDADDGEPAEPTTSPPAPEASTPVVQVLAPRDRSEVESPFTLEAQISADAATAGVVLLVDDAYFTSWSRPPYRAELSLPPGPHLLTVVVEDPAGDGLSTAINVVVVEPPMGVTANGAAAPAPPLPSGPAAPAAVAVPADAAYEGGGVSTGCALTSAPAPGSATLPVLLSLLGLLCRRRENQRFFAPAKSTIMTPRTTEQQSTRR